MPLHSRRGRRGGEAEEAAEPAEEQQQQQQEQQPTVAATGFVLEDIVQLVGDSSQIGTVTELGGAEAAADEDEDDGRVRPGDVRITWLREEDPTDEDPADVTLVDRPFLLGDTVARCADPDGPSGTVVGTHVALDLAFPDGSVARGVPADRVRPLFVVHEQAWVVQGDWVGVVDRCICDVVVLFEDRSLCVVRSVDGDTSLDALSYSEPTVVENAAFPFWPGLLVTVSRSELQQVAWIRRPAARAVHTNGIVTEVRPVELVVNWVAGRTADGDPPEETVSADSVVPLRLFQKGNWAIGDRAICPPELRLGEEAAEAQAQAQAPTEEVAAAEAATAALDADTATRQEEPPRSKPRRGKPHKKATRRKGCKAVLHATEGDAPNTGEVVCMHTLVDVKWQDGTVTTNEVSTQLVPLQDLPPNEFWPDEYVTLAAASDAEETRSGVIQRVDSAARMATVHWLDGKPGPEIQEVPVFSLKLDDRFDLREGDVVARIPSTDLSQAPSPAQADDASSLVERVTGLLQSMLSRIGGFRQTTGGWVGEIANFRDGKVVVAWADGTISEVGPEELIVVSLDNGAEEEEEEEEYDEEEEEEEEPEEEVARTADTAQANPSKWWSEDVTASHSMFGDSFGSASLIPQDPEIPPIDRGDVPQPADATTVSAATAADSVPERQQEQFAILEGSPRAHFFMQKVSPNALPHALAARIPREWGLLRNASSSGVFVRAYEEQMQLLQFLVIAPDDTPYEDGVFLFDMFVPATYPSTPPEVHYCSVGPRIHPNLYENGTVCLSILGTWAGNQAERWQPATSNLLQVVLSIQGIVLGQSDPYFLEPGLESQRGTPHGDHQSQAYNEAALLFTLRSMIGYAARPPEPWAAVITEHFSRRGDAILERCRCFAENRPPPSPAPSQTPASSSSSSSPSHQRTWSRGFCTSLTALLPQLEEAFKAANERSKQL